MPLPCHKADFVGQPFHARPPVADARRHRPHAGRRHAAVFRDAIVDLRRRWPRWRRAGRRGRVAADRAMETAMGLMDSLGGAAGGFDLGAIAGKVGLSEEQVKHGLAALVQASREHGETIRLAQQKTGLPLDKLQGLLAAIGGEGGLSAAGALLGGGGAGGGLGGALGGLMGRG
jgi:hypothetical protein